MRMETTYCASPASPRAPRQYFPAQLVGAVHSNVSVGPAEAAQFGLEGCGTAPPRVGDYVHPLQLAVAVEHFDRHGCRVQILASCP